MGKNIAAGVAGVVVAMLLVMIVEMLGHAVYPPPTDLNFADPDSMQAYISTLPVGALLFVAAAWFVATLGGVLVACYIGTARNMIFAGVITGLMLLATTYNLVVIPHPVWFSITGVAGILVAAWLGLQLAPADDGATPE